MRFLIGRDDLTAAAVSAVESSAPGTPVDTLTIRPVHNGSKQFVNDSAIDICELAIVTLLQAVAYGKPVGLLPITALGRFQHQTLVTVKGLSVNDIAGKTVGVRSWSQTTGVWLRGFLTEDYDLKLRDSDWVAYEDGHIAEYRDPAWVRRAPAGAKLVADFVAGDVDYAILGNDLPDDKRARTAIPEAEEAAARWSKQNGFAPINHVIGVSLETARRQPESICAVYDAMAEVAANRAEGQDPVMEPFGFDGLRAPFSRAAKFALEQEILPRPVDFDEVVARTCEALGVDARRLGG